MGVIIGIILLAMLWNTAGGRFLIGIIAKIFYSSIAISICMAIPIPLLNIALALYLVCLIWTSPVE